MASRLTRRSRMRRTSRRSLVFALVLLAAIAGAIYLSRGRRLTPEPGPAPGKLIARFLDIGQGDAELIQLPDGETILIDSGDRGAATDELLGEFGVRQIDLIIATHPHADHIGDMREVLRRFKVKEFWDAGFPYSTKTYTDLLQEIKDRGIKLSVPKQGESRRLGEVLLEVLHPTLDLPDNNPNNASVVVRLTFGATRLLFTGDTEIESWKQMLQSENDSLRADLLKAAHHGSSNGTSEAVLNAVHPSVYTISCASGNDYHHPQPGVMNLLDRHREIAVYRTDLQGTITAVCDGNTIQMQTERQVAGDRLYLTGDEVAGKVASDGSGRKALTRQRGAGHTR